MTQDTLNTYEIENTIIHLQKPEPASTNGSIITLSECLHVTTEDIRTQLLDPKKNDKLIPLQTAFARTQTVRHNQDIPLTSFEAFYAGAHYTPDQIATQLSQLGTHYRQLLRSRLGEFNILLKPFLKDGIVKSSHNKAVKGAFLTIEIDQIMQMVMGLLRGIRCNNEVAQATNKSIHLAVSPAHGKITHNIDTSTYECILPHLQTSIS